MTNQDEPGKEGGQELADLLDRLAAEAQRVERREREGRVEYLREGRLFAARQRSEGHFRLRPEIVRAALATPGTARSPMGDEWVMLRAGRLDRFTTDRARAWFDLAAREAAKAAER